MHDISDSRGKKLLELFLNVYIPYRDVYEPILSILKLSYYAELLILMILFELEIVTKTGSIFIL